MTTAVHVSCAGSGCIDVLHLDPAQGRLEAVQRVALGGQVMPLALSPTGRHLYAVRRSAPMAVVSMAINPLDGRLDVLGEAELPASLPYISTDHTGRWLLGASYQQGLVLVCAIGADGRAAPPHQVLGSGEKTHCVLATPDNREVLATVLGQDEVLRYGFDAGSGRLGEQQTLRVAAGSGPRHIALHPHGRGAWVLGELDGQVRSLSGLHTASALPEGFDGSPWAADLRLAPGGRFLYASERTSSTLTLFWVDADSGALERRGQWPTQAQPRGFAISPCGRWLLCAGQRSRQVGVHAIDAASGDLQPHGACAVGDDPNWVEMLALDPSAPPST